MTNLIFLPEAWSDYLDWQGQDKKTLRRINQMLQEILRSPFEGIGKPEPLQGDLSGWWSRRIDAANRIVYQVDNHGAIKIAQCKGHYGDK